MSRSKISVFYDMNDKIHPDAMQKQINTAFTTFTDRLLVVPGLFKGFDAIRFGLVRKNYEKLKQENKLKNTYLKKMSKRS